MNINRNNYEKYFIDYLEGTLSKDDIYDLRVFLLFNQDLAELLDDIAKIKLTAPSVRYTRKENLKKDELHACKDYYAIAIAENSLSTQDISDIKHSSRKQEITKQAEVYRQLKLTPDTKIRYTRKSKLYHSAYRQLGYKYSSIAAILLLILTIAITVLKSDDIHPQATEITMVLPPAIEIPAIDRVLFIKEQSLPPLPCPKPVIPVQPTRIPVMTIQELPICGITPTSVQEAAKIRMSSPAFNSSELILTENAIAWKPSESKFLSNNLFSSMINTGKMIAEKLKNNIGKE